MYGWEIRAETETLNWKQTISMREGKGEVIQVPGDVLQRYVR